MIGLRGEYRITKLSDDKVISRTPWFDNLITDAGLDLIGTTDSYLGLASVGTGTTVAAISDTQLETPLATCTELFVSLGARFRKHTFAFAKGSVVGTVSEVGIGGFGTSLFSRALVPSPQVFTKSHALELEYRLNVIPPEQDITIVLTFAPDTYTTSCRVRPAWINSSSGFAWGPSGNRAKFASGAILMPTVYDCLMGLRNGAPTGASDSRDFLTEFLYTPGSHCIEALACWKPSSANFKQPIQSALFFTNGYGAWQMEFNPTIAKSCQEVLKLRFNLCWNRA